MSYMDPPEMETGDVDALTPELLADPLERAAIALWSMGYMTPEEVGGKLSTAPAQLVKAWCGGPGVAEYDRHLYRRRAAMVLQAHSGTIEPSEPEPTDPLFSPEEGTEDDEHS
jgi:hypothetical protein